MKKILIIGSAPNSVLDKNILQIRKFFKKEKYSLNLLVTKDYKNDIIDEYVDFPSGFIKEDMKFNLSEYEHTIVCQSNYIRSEFLNIYIFLKNNGIKKTYVIYTNNEIKIFNISKINKLFLLVFKYLGFYKKLGF